VIRLEDLDPKTRRKILQAPLPLEGLDPKLRRKVRRPVDPDERRSPVPQGGLPLRCRECGRVYSEWAAIERHVNGRHGGGTIENVLPHDPEGANVRGPSHDPEESS